MGHAAHNVGHAAHKKAAIQGLRVSAARAERTGKNRGPLGLA